MEIGRGIIWWGWWIAAAALLAPAEAAAEDPARGADGREVHRLVERLHEAQGRRVAEREAHRREVERVERAVERLRGEAAEAEEAVERRREAAAELGAAIRRKRAERGNAVRVIEAAAGAAGPIVERMARRIGEGIGYQREERGGRVERIAAGLGADGEAERGEAVGRLWGFIGEELQSARGVELWNEPIVLGDGRRKHAHRARIGLVGELFVTEDGEVAGVWSEGGWRVDLSEAERAQVVEAVEVLRGRRPPRLAPVPFDGRRWKVERDEAGESGAGVSGAEEGAPAGRATPPAENLEDHGQDARATAAPEEGARDVRAASLPEDDGRDAPPEDHGQDAPPEDHGQDARATGVLGRLEGELAAEEEALAEARGQWAAELGELTGRRAELAERLLDRRIEHERLRRRVRGLEEESAALGMEVDRLGEVAAAVVNGARGLAEQLRIYLEETPGSEESLETLGEITTALAEGGGASAGVEWAIGTLLELVDRVHRDAGAVTVRESAIWAAGGERRAVRLLAAGGAAFAYETVEGGAVGVALRSPADASGYRWTQRVPERTAEAVRAAIAAVEAGGGGPVGIPMDVSGELRVEAVDGAGGLAERLRAGGPVMIPLAIVAVLALGLVAERAWVLYGRNREDEALVRRVLGAARGGRYEEAEAICESGRGVVGRTLAAALRRLGRGQGAMEDSIHEQLLHELPRLQRFLGGIAILAAVAPLLGLLGTVTGIIQTFGVIRAFGGGNVDLMAGGISEALVTTATGLSIAIPILLAHTLLRGRVDRILAAAEKHAATLLNILSHEGEPSEAEGEMTNV